MSKSADAEMPPLAHTFDDDKRIAVAVISMSPGGLCKVLTFDGRTLARHKDRLDPINSTARKMLRGDSGRP